MLETTSSSPAGKEVRQEGEDRCEGCGGTLQVMGGKPTCTKCGSPNTPD